MDANQIAQQEARRRQDTSREPGFNQGPEAPPKFVKPQRGTLRVWEQITDMKHRAFAPLLEVPSVTVNVGNPGLIIATEANGTKSLIYPRPGWYAEFVPDAEG